MLKGSRYYLFGVSFVLLSAVLAWHFDESGVFTTITTTWMAIAGTKSVIGTHHTKGTDG